MGSLVTSMSPFNNPVVLELLARYRSVAAMIHASALLGWDLEINMPEAGAGARGQSQSEIELLPRLFSRKHHCRNALERSDEKGLASRQKREEHCTVEKLAGGEHPQARIDILPEGVAKPGLRQRIRPIRTSRVSREQVPRNELNQISLTRCQNTDAVAR